MNNALTAADESAAASRKFLQDIFIQAVGSAVTSIAMHAITAATQTARNATATVARAVPREARGTVVQGAHWLGEAAQGQAEQAPERIRQLMEWITPPESTQSELPGAEPEDWGRSLRIGLNTANTESQALLRQIVAEIRREPSGSPGSSALDPAAVIAQFERRCGSLPPELPKEDYAQMMWREWLRRWLSPENPEAPRTIPELDTAVQGNRRLLDAAAQSMKTRAPIDAAILTARQRLQSAPPQTDGGPVRTRWRRQHPAQTPGDPN